MKYDFKNLYPTKNLNSCQEKSDKVKFTLNIYRHFLYIALSTQVVSCEQSQCLQIMVCKTNSSQSVVTILIMFLAAQRNPHLRHVRAPMIHITSVNLVFIVKNKWKCKWQIFSLLQYIHRMSLNTPPTRISPPYNIQNRNTNTSLTSRRQHHALSITTALFYVYISWINKLKTMVRI